MPWAVVTALAYVGAIAGGVISATYQLDVDRNDPAEVEAAQDEVAEASTRMAKWTSPLSFALNATAAWFLHRLARSWSDLQETPPAS